MVGGWDRGEGPKVWWAWGRPKFTSVTQGALLLPCLWRPHGDMDMEVIVMLVIFCKDGDGSYLHQVPSEWAPLLPHATPFGPTHLDSRSALCLVPRGMGWPWRKCSGLLDEP